MQKYLDFSFNSIQKSAGIMPGKITHKAFFPSQVEGCLGIGSRGTQLKSRGSGRYELCCGRERAAKNNHCGIGMEPSDRMSINDVERKLKEGLYSTKTKQGKSDNWRSFSIICDKDGNELDC